MPCEVYPVESIDEHSFWSSVTDISCPVKGCNQTVVWYEAGYVPGFRVCMKRVDEKGFDEATKQHHFLTSGTITNPVLIRDRRFEEEHQP